MSDVWTVMQKEWKELSLIDGGWMALTTLLGFVALVGIFLPWQLGPAWVSSSWVLAFWTWMPLFLVTTVTADSFAGERERRTLETLLATRLPDWSIVVGKIGAAVLWVWGATMICLPVGLVTVNLAHGDGQVLLYDGTRALGIGAIAFLAGLLGAALGVLVSLRARSVRHAQQTLAIFTMGLFLTPIFALRLLPPIWANEIFVAFGSDNAGSIILAMTTTLLVLDAVLLVVALSRFQRHKLLFD